MSHVNKQPGRKACELMQANSEATASLCEAEMAAALADALIADLRETLSLGNLLNHPKSLPTEAIR